MNARELKERLEKEYPYRIEMHAHTTPISPCSEIPPATMAQIYSDKGYDAVVIANHFTPDNVGKMPKNEAIDWYYGAVKETEEFAKKTGLKVFLGIEIRFTENHNDYLIYGADRDTLSVCYDYLDRGVQAFREEVDLGESVFLQAHPFRNGMELCEPRLLDGIETFNMHPHHNSRVAVASRYAKENGFPIQSAGSDFHHLNLGHEAVSALRTKVMPENSYDIAKILRSGDYIFEVGESALILP